MNYSIKKSINNWTQIFIPKIVVTNGSIQVGVYSNANGGNWLNVDDYNLVLESEPFCYPTELSPKLRVNGGVWSDSTIAEVNVGDEITFSPEPATEGSWIWNGPSGYTANTRMITIKNIKNYQGGNYVATYTNGCGAKSSISFKVNVTGQGSTSITIQENQLGFCGVDGTIDTNNTGFSGDGFANTNNALAAGVNYKLTFLESGTYPFVFKYANGGSNDRPGKLLINNSVAVPTISLKPTGSWNSWTTTSANVSVNAGTYNIRLESTGSEGLGNIDYLEVFGTTVFGDSCNAIVTDIHSITQRNDDQIISCYPVPVNDQLNIVFNKDLNQTVNLVLINSVGETLYSTSFRNGVSHKISTSFLPAGMYLVRISGTNINKYITIVK